MNVITTPFRLLRLNLAAIAGLYAVPAMADCDAVLRDGAFSRIHIQSDSYARTVYAARLASMTYEEARRETSGGVSLPIEGIPLAANFSQDEFREFQNSVRSSIDVDSVNRHSSSILRVTGDPQILAAWSDCKGKEGGLIVTVEPRGPTAAVASMEWWPTPGSSGNSPVVNSVHVDGGTVVSGEEWMRRGVQLGTRAKRLITIRREREGPVLVTISTDFMDQSAYLPRVYSAPTPAIAQRYPVGECTGAGGVEGVHFWGPPSQYCNGIAEWGRYSSSERSVAALGACRGRGGVEGVTLYGPAGSTCAGIAAWGSYEGSTSVKDGIGSCVGRGTVLAGHLLFGPKGLSCGGFPEWGKYQ